MYDYGDNLRQDSVSQQLPVFIPTVLRTYSGNIWSSNLITKKNTDESAADPPLMSYTKFIRRKI